MTTLTFTKLPFLCGSLGKESVVPHIMTLRNVQNQTKFHLDEFDEIYEAYGQVKTAYPYRQQESYKRDLETRQLSVAILENDLIQAIFLTEYGGRLWSLRDLKNKRDLLYTNDCIRASNLAVRNAWFSGGVEWNCGIIGHTPFTMDRVFAARVEKDGVEALRMYTYERIRGVVYQMDFWLDDRVPALNCHMSIHNPNGELVPMYWWTNIASPLYPEGRILVPAHKAYSHDQGCIEKVDIPVPREGWDVSRYETIPVSRDFFFELDRGEPRWIANVNREGQGLLHLSTDRLQSRKLFVWGQTEGGKHWQEYLTENAGPYLEIQAGLGKTQYGCIPMAPHTTWQWSERFQGIRADPALDFEAAVETVSGGIRKADPMEAVDAFGCGLRTVPGQVMMEGLGDGALQDALRKAEGLPPMREYLDFTSGDSRQALWYEFLETGVLPEPREDFPAYDPCGSRWLQRLEASGEKNWYCWYCIALLQWQAGRLDLALTAARKSVKLRRTACGSFALAVFSYENGSVDQAVRYASAALHLGGGELSLAKPAVKLLYRCRAWKTLLTQVKKLPRPVRQDSRIRLFCAQSLYELEEYEQSLEMLTESGGMKLEDVREGELAMGELWNRVTEKLYGSPLPMPHGFEFNATDAGTRKSPADT